MAKKPPQPKWMELFYEFMGNMTISSKELDSAKPVPLLDVLYTAQHRFLEEIAEGLGRGIKDFKILKSRQLGVSTVSLALDVFWASIHDKLQGALITDTDGNRDKFRILLEQYIESLPRGLRVGIKQHNRNNLVLMNGSVIDYLVAGTRGKKGSLGTSRALNFVHATEISNWGSTEADIANLQASLAEKHPHRLYIWESTARGFGNEWYDMCQSAQADEYTQKLFFLGWFLKEDYSFDRESAEYSRWSSPINAEEEAIEKDVREESNWEITDTQWAWHRHMRSMKILDPDLMRQNYPSTAKEAFIMTGRSFFPLQRVADNLKLIHADATPMKAFRYHMGIKFDATEIQQLDSTRDADLRVWAEPHPNGVYVLGFDVAYGRSDDKDRHAIEVYRCYADRLVQVAEYCTSVPETYQAAWVMAHLAGIYKSVIINLEVNGPGAAIMDEMRHLRQLLDNHLLPGVSANNNGEVAEVFSAVRWFLYHRTDSMGAGYAYNFVTNQSNKLMIMNQLRDTYSVGQLEVNSVPLLEEMERVVQEGGEIAAEGRAHDDRVFASALAVHAWIKWVRGGMINTNQIYDKVMEEERINKDTPHASMINSIVSSFFVERAQARSDREESDVWGAIE